MGYDLLIEPVYLRIWAFLLLTGLVLWLSGNQIGLARILERKRMSRGRKMVEHLKMMVISPIAAPIETSAALYATIKWLLGYRTVKWTPTRK